MCRVEHFATFRRCFARSRNCTAYVFFLKVSCFSRNLKRSSASLQNAPVFHVRFNVESDCRSNQPTVCFCSATAVLPIMRSLSFIAHKTIPSVTSTLKLFVFPVLAFWPGQFLVCCWENFFSKTFSKLFPEQRSVHEVQFWRFVSNTLYFQMRSLDLSNNNLSNIGAASLCKALRNIDRLNLSKCGLTSEGINKLAEVYKELDNPVLSHRPVLHNCYIRYVFSQIIQIANPFAYTQQLKSAPKQSGTVDLYLSISLYTVWHLSLSRNYKLPQRLIDVNSKKFCNKSEGRRGLSDEINMKCF